MENNIENMDNNMEKSCENHGKYEKHGKIM